MSAAYVRAVVSDAGGGGQVLLDSVTFGIIKDRLEELGQVCACLLGGGGGLKLDTFTAQQYSQQPGNAA
jgi:hypothetical protein